MNMNSLGTLRDIKDNELELMRSWRNAPAVRENMYTRHEISAQEHLAWWGRTKERSDQKYFMYEVDGGPIGIVGFTLIDFVSRNCAWAFYAAPGAPRGSGSKMEFLAIEYVFNDLKLNKLYCEVLDFNASVIKLHKKFGFQTEGIFVKQHKTDEGYSDIHRLGLFAEEWAARRTEMRNKLLFR